MDLNAGKPERTDMWTNDLSVGVDIIYEDHQAFFRLAKLLHDVMESSDKNQDALIETAINILEEYVAGHFLREETANRPSRMALIIGATKNPSSSALMIGRRQLSWPVRRQL